MITAEDGTRLTIPLGAEGAERLFDALRPSPGSTSTPAWRRLQPAARAHDGLEEAKDWRRAGVCNGGVEGLHADAMTSGEPALDGILPGRLNQGRHPHPRAGGLRRHARRRPAGCRDPRHSARSCRRGHVRARHRGACHDRAAGATSATVGYKGYQHAVHLDQPRRLPRHPARADACWDGDILNIDVTVILDGLARRLLGHVLRRAPRREARAADRHHPRRADERHRSRCARAARFGDIGAAIQRFAEATAARWCATSAATASGRVFHAAPNVRTTAAGAGTACSSRGCSSPSSR